MDYFTISVSITFFSDLNPRVCCAVSCYFLVQNLYTAAPDVFLPNEKLIFSSRSLFRHCIVDSPKKWNLLRAQLSPPFESTNLTSQFPTMLSINFCRFHQRKPLKGTFDKGGAPFAAHRKPTYFHSSSLRLFHFALFVLFPSPDALWSMALHNFNGRLQKRRLLPKMGGIAKKRKSTKKVS